MSELPLSLGMLRGSWLGYLLAGLCIVGLLTLRALSTNPAVRSRALVAVFLFLVFAVLRLPLLFLDPATRDLEGRLVPSAPYQVLHVLSLVVFSLALIQGLILILVEALLAGRLKMEIPHILSDVAAVAVFLISVLAILYYQTDLNVTGVLGTAGVLSIVLGLALQDTLGNVFGGLALQMERPFRVGDWISFGDFEGVITDVSWRSTQFRTRNNDLVTVPNSTISKESFVNHSSPSKVSGRVVEVGVHYRHPPADVKRVLLAACGEVPEILPRPRPLVRLKSFDDSAITYQVKFWIRDYAAVLDIEEGYRTVLWYAFKREGIEIPFPIQIEYQVEPPSEEQQKKEAEEHVFERLQQAEFLSPLSEKELRTLAQRAKLLSYYTNETICRQDEEGDSFFLLDEGEVVVAVSKNGQQQEVARLEPPAVFGEMALCTGERRTATVRATGPVRLLVIDGDSFRSVITANPQLATEISRILAKRQVELVAKRQALDDSLAASQDETSRQILARIRGWLGFGHDGRETARSA